MNLPATTDQQHPSAWLAELIVLNKFLRFGRTRRAKEKAPCIAARGLKRIFAGSAETNAIIG